MSEQNKGGRPPAPPQMQRVNVPLRLPRWLMEWISEQCSVGPLYKTPTKVVEDALIKAYNKARPPKK